MLIMLSSAERSRDSEEHDARLGNACMSRIPKLQKLGLDACPQLSIRKTQPAVKEIVQTKQNDGLLLRILKDKREF